MRKISANLILPVSSAPLRNGIILVNPDGSIADLIDTGGHLREEPGLEYYPGTIIPGLVIPWFRMDEFSADQNPVEPEEMLEKLDRELFRHGIKGVGLVLSESTVTNGGLKFMGKSSLCYHPVIELCPGRNDDEYEVFNRGIDLISQAWNEFNLSCSLSACSHAMKYSDIGKFLEEYGRSHMNLLPPKGETPKDPKPTDPNQPQQPDSKNYQVTDENKFNILNNFLLANPEMSFEEGIRKITLDSAEKIFAEDQLGSIEKGKKPGLNLVSGFAEGDSAPYSKMTIKVLV
jgi:hypothetical protein